MALRLKRADRLARNRGSPGKKHSASLPEPHVGPSFPDLALFNI